MRRAVRHENGDLLTDLEWKAIRQSAALIARTHFMSLDRSGFGAAGRSRKKAYYKRYFNDVWIRAIRELERVAPLLSLCAGTWKADMTLGSVISDDRISELPSPPPTNIAPPSLAATPSSIGSHSHVAPHSSSTSRSAAPSRASTPSSLTRPSHAPPSPRRASFKSSKAPPRVSSTAVQPPPEPQPASKATGSKAKRKRDASPLPRNDKKSKSSAIATGSGAGACQIFIFELS
jgi:hypothetical protein